jgi:phospholipid/cholesterol/gamma-HCH transport system ATP-binding protein
MISVENITKSYGERMVINNVSFKVPRKSITVILGSSGGGKSTLLKLLIGALKPDSGRVIIDGNNISQIRENELSALRKHIGMLFQNVALFGEMTIGENVGLPIKEHTDLDDAVVEIMVKMKLEQVGLSDFEALYPRELSGGMQKRVGIARAIALDPKIVFFDEPTAGLDPVMSGMIHKLIVDLTRLLGITSVVVTHSMEGALQIGDRLVLLYGGKIYFEGTSLEIDKSPDPLVQQFLHGSAEGPIPMRKSAEEYRKSLLE